MPQPMKKIAAAGGLKMQSRLENGHIVSLGCVLVGSVSGFACAGKQDSAPLLSCLCVLCAREVELVKGRQTVFS